MDIKEEEEEALGLKIQLFIAFHAFFVVAAALADGE